MDQALIGQAQTAATNAIHASSGFAPLDALVVIVVGLSCFWGVWKGLSKELVGLTVLGLTAFSTFFYAGFLTPWLKTYISVEWLCSLVSGILVFGGFWIVFKLVARWIAMLMRQALSAPIDILLGGIYGLARGWVVLALLFWAGQSSFPSYMPVVEQHCAFYPLLGKTVTQMQVYRERINGTLK